MIKNIIDWKKVLWAQVLKYLKEDDNNARNICAFCNLKNANLGYVCRDCCDKYLDGYLFFLDNSKKET